MIQIRGFSAYYKEKRGLYMRALNNIDLDITDGEFLVIVGPSGCGKTTLIRALLDKCDLTKGEILIDGIMNKDLPLKNRNFAYVSQTITLFPALTVYDNIAFPLKVMKLGHDEIDTRVKDIADKLDISLLLTRKPRAISGGQQQRVAIARALIKNPRALLMDEPFSDLHPSLREELRSMLKNLHEKQRPTFVFATHDATEAYYLADRIVIINQGEIQQIGTPQEIFENPASPFAKQFMENVNV